MADIEFDSEVDFDTAEFDTAEFYESTTRKATQADIDIMFPPEDRSKAIKAMRDRIIAAFEARLTPKDVKPLDIWVEENFSFPEGSVLPGKFSFAPAEFQREIYHSLTDPTVKDVILCMGSQLAKTQSIVCLAAYALANENARMLIGQPSEALAHTFAKTILQPQLHHNVPEYISPKSTIKEIHGYGSIINIVTANSPKELAMRSVKIAVIDELDEIDVSKQGSPLSVIRARTTVYDQMGAKVIASSSPRDHGVIWQEFLEGDQRHYYVACLSCGHYYRMEWDARDEEDPGNVGVVVYENDDPDTARVKCPQCGHLHTNDEKNKQVKSGHWRPHNPDSHKRSYRINSIYSSFVTIETLVYEWLDATKPYKNPAKLQPFVNTRLAKLFFDKSKSEENEKQIISIDERIVQSVPFPIWRLYAGADQQSGATDGRLEVTIIAVSEDLNQICVLKHHRIFGNIHYHSVWDTFDIYVRSYSYQGHTIRKCSIDSAPEGAPVRRLCQSSSLFVPIKGDATLSILVDQKPHKNKAAGPTYHIGEYLSKEVMDAMIKQGQVTWLEGFVEDEYIDAYWDQLNAEERKEVTRQGIKKIVWQCPSGKRNEAWDCIRYAFAVANIKDTKRKKRLPPINTRMRL